jgi:hypothetical protein
VLALCHDRRNRAEYGGDADIDDQLITELTEAAEQVLEKLAKLGSVPPAR